jgi:hypothetical protein
MGVRHTDTEVLERRCQSWEKTRQRGQFLYALVQGVILGGFWFLVNILLNSISKLASENGENFGGISYEAMALVSFFFFLVGFFGAPKTWDKAQKRYEIDKQYIEVMRQQDSNSVK